MISGLKKEYPKASKSVLQKAQYEQKNSNVNLKDYYYNKEFLDIYSSFRNKLIPFKKKFLVVAVSGGPDSLALTALSNFFHYQTGCKIYYVLIDHNLRKNSSKEAIKVKKLLKSKNQSTYYKK